MTTGVLEDEVTIEATDVIYDVVEHVITDVEFVGISGREFDIEFDVVEKLKMKLL